MEYLSVEEARLREGTRLVLTAGVPGPWGEAAKGILACKGMAFIPVRQDAGQANESLRAWTGQDSAPVLVIDDLPPIIHWQDILLHAERLVPQNPLLPAELHQRVAALGLCGLIAGVNGLGWQRRLMLLSPGMQTGEPPEMIVCMARKYGWSPAAAASAPRVLEEICGHLDAVLARSEAQGGGYFLGEDFSAVDIYWATFAGMFAPLPAEVNPMPDYVRAGYASGGEWLQALLTPRLLDHRDRIYQRHLALPLNF
ncbi:glutathione S-transferase [Parahaliea maris]|uniref:Glutathione S-transferase n=1 Tax=Parahaliea maris TaxID=2716870 RepID=A0A5C9A849_9GAMM|nr:glutathione S-transferase C-terminal domain-containing protein [Parahaliea maris]TXS95737.1 glutathione S-transferase [Parahaliea maris]